MEKSKGKGIKKSFLGSIFLYQISIWEKEENKRANEKKFSI